MKVTDLEMCRVLPSKDDQEDLFDDLVPLVYRELVKYLPSYAPFKCGVQHHIAHPHSEEMKRKSEQVFNSQNICFYFKVPLAWAGARVV